MSEMNKINEEKKLKQEENYQLVHELDEFRNKYEM